MYVRTIEIMQRLSFRASGAWGIDFYSTREFILRNLYKKKCSLTFVTKAFRGRAEKVATLFSVDADWIPTSKRHLTLKRNCHGVT